MKPVISFSKKMKARILLFVSFFIFSLALFSQTLFAQVMQSTTYKIMSDSINAGGEDVSSSTNYLLGDTLGEVGTGDSNSTNYYLHAGFWQMQESYIAITSPSDLGLTSIGGITGEGTEGTVSWQVITDNFAGYTISIETTTTPALTSAQDSFANYTPSGADPDYTFSIVSSASEFGFSPEGTDTNSRFKDNGSACNTGSGEVSAKCWDGLSTSAQTIAGKTSSNHPSGSAVNVRFRAESGSAHIQTSGNYSSTVIVTAVVL